MKTLTKYLTTTMLGLSLAAFTLNATQANYSCQASNTGSDENGDDLYMPAGTGVGWYDYAYTNASAYVSIWGNGVSVSDTLVNDGYHDGSGSTTAAGTLSFRIGCQTSYGGAAGAGVTINW